MPWVFEKWWRLSLFAFAFWSIPWGCGLRSDYAFSKRGVTTEATITGPWPYKTHLAKGSYEVNGVRFSTCVNTPNWVRYSPDLIGSKVPITYDRQHPENARNGDLRGTFLGSVFEIIPIALMSLFVGYVGRLIHRVHLRRMQKTSAGATDGTGAS